MSSVKGTRSSSAATAAGHRRFYNVSTGIKGDHGEAARRGSAGGWKHDGLPWVQG